MKIKSDCLYFKGSVPCTFHKQEGIHCDDCRNYSPIKERVLIVKLDAVGDVLRTTSILPGLKEKYPYSQITWITKKESAPLFDGNTFVDRLIELNQAIYTIHSEKFDLLINLDSSPLSSQLASIANAVEKRGFSYSPQGFVYPLNPEAENWFLMGVYDDAKKANSETYQSIMLHICNIASRNCDIQYVLKPGEIEFSRKFIDKNNLHVFRHVIGINSGAGNRWEKKKWTIAGYIELIRLIKATYPDMGILLYGGPDEYERNAEIMKECKGLAIETGCNHSIRNFAALLNISSLVVTGDTLALHLAVSLKKKVVALIGPTSSTELELYGRGEKITADMPCLCCYKSRCDKNPDCMEQITAEMVFVSVKRLLCLP